MSGKIVSLKMSIQEVEKVEAMAKELATEHKYQLHLRSGRITFSQAVRILLMEAIDARGGSQASLNL